MPTEKDHGFLLSFVPENNSLAAKGCSTLFFVAF